MTRKKKQLIITITITAILVAAGIVVFVFYPPAGVILGIIAAAAVTWCVTRAFDSIADQVAQTLPTTDHVLDETEPHESHVHTHTLIMSRDIVDEHGRHITETVTDITRDDDEPKPTKHKLGN